MNEVARFVSIAGVKSGMTRDMRFTFEQTMDTLEIPPEYEYVEVVGPEFSKGRLLSISEVEYASQ